MIKGRFITFEGGEGAGKSTQTARLAGTLRARGHEVVTTREPGGTPEAERIRDLLLGEDALDWDPRSEALLHYAARRQHVATLIRPALERGLWVISDRFSDSTMAYQGYGSGVPIDIIRAIAAATLDGLQPDLTMILDIDPAMGIERARARSPESDRYERKSLGFHRRLRQGFREIAALEPARCIVIDATLDEDGTARAVLVAVDERLPVDPG